MSPFLDHDHDHEKWGQSGSISFYLSNTEYAVLRGTSKLNWSRKVHFAQSWLGRHSIPTWFHQKWWPENFTLLALRQTTTNAPSIIPYPMGGQIFKVIFLQFWLQIQIPGKKLPEETIFLFSIFWKEVGQTSQKLKNKWVS